ncbi:MAG: transglycosylase domain-containing protein [Hungatella sp.]|nr:transglycosylase domain-containing protein [Hungatella sp.]
MKKCWQVLRRLLFLAAVVCICSGFTVAGKGYAAYREAVEEMSLEEKVALIRSKDTYTEYEELPQVYVQAVIAVEDKRFERHMGFDVIAICRAIRNDIRARALVEGGSTITQQLAKNMYFEHDRDLTRKVAEVFVAMDLERAYTKDEIFELYVNGIYFGDGYYDVASASRGYFGKEPEEMSQYESTLLAGIPNAPSAYAPTKHPDLAAKRQLKVLERMEACGYLSAQEAETVAETAAGLLADVR